MDPEGKYTSNPGSTTLEMTLERAFFCTSSRSDSLEFGIVPSQRGTKWFWERHRSTVNRNNNVIKYFMNRSFSPMYIVFQLESIPSSFQSHPRTFSNLFFTFCCST